MRRPEYTPCELPLEAVERIPWLRKRLLSSFKRNGRSFPWREPATTAYEVVVAEILLQRTAAVGVARAYPGFIACYPSWATLVQAPCEGLENALRPLGLWRQKALAFQHLAQSIEELGGVVPCSRHALALRLVSGKRSLQVNWAVLDFGALVCKARRPRCQECPLRVGCQYARSPGRATPTSNAL